jgi:hypothetical protein
MKLLRSIINAQYGLDEANSMSSLGQGYVDVICVNKATRHSVIYNNGFGENEWICY